MSSTTAWSHTVNLESFIPYSEDNLGGPRQTPVRWAAVFPGHVKGPVAACLVPWSTNPGRKPGPLQHHTQIVGSGHLKQWHVWLSLLLGVKNGVEDLSVEAREIIWMCKKRGKSFKWGRGSELGNEVRDTTKRWRMMKDLDLNRKKEHRHKVYKHGQLSHPSNPTLNGRLMWRWLLP